MTLQILRVFVTTFYVIIQEKRNHTNIDDSIFIYPHLLITIKNNDFAEEVACIMKGESLLCFLWIYHNAVCL